LCWRRLELEKRAEGPCFQRQLKRCRGACVGAEESANHDERAAAALAPFSIPRWPFAGPALIRERSTINERTDVHVLRNWCWLGTARDEGELAALLDAPPHPRFDIDVTRLLLKRWNRRSLALVDVAPDAPSLSS
jgi:DNA polymerase-3 subunit epsilon